MQDKSVINTPFILSNDQERIVYDRNKYIKVEAAAGTGKTETIARKILYLMIEDKIEPKNIVAFTFTEKAAKEMKARVYNVAGMLENKSIIDHLGEMYIGTIHGYCKRILEDQFSYGDYTIFDENKEIAFLLRIGWELEIDKYEKSYTRSVLAFHRTVNMVYSELMDEKKLMNASPDFYEKFKNYEKLLTQNKIMTFGKLIYDGVTEIGKNKDKIHKLGLSYLFVDEFQDINPSQYKLIKLLVSNHSGLMVVGDERQTIYQWRGSDHKLFKRIECDFKNLQIFYLNENMRSLKSIVDNANVFSKTLSGSYKNMISTRLGSQIMFLGSYSNEEEEARWIAKTISELVSSGSLNYNDMAILLRSVKSKGRNIVEEFKKKNIPYQVGGKIGLFQREEGQVLGMLFSWLIDMEWKQDDHTLKSDELLDAIESISKNVFHRTIFGITGRELLKIKERIYETIGKNRYQNITEIFQDLLVALHFENLNPEDSIDLTVMANIGRFNNLLTDFETARRIGGKNVRWKNEMKSLYYYIATYAMDAYEEAQPDVDTELNAVQIMTVHQAKGLEWPFLILAEINKNNFPSSMTGRTMNWCGIPSDTFDSARYQGTDDDERRLFYVAITRPRDVLAVTHISRRESSFLNNIEKGLFGEPDLKKVGWSSRKEKKDNLSEFSPSEIIWYLRCPYMYRLRKKWGYQPGLKEEIGFGNAMHSVLRNAVKLVKEEGIAPVSAIKEASDTYFHLPFAGSAIFNRLKKKSEDILDNFVRNNPEFLTNAEEVEYRVNYKNGTVAISGRADLILSDGNEKIVADYKTNRNVNTAEETEIQIGAYTSGLRKSGIKANHGKVVYLQECEVDEIVLDENKIKEIDMKIENLVTDIESKKFSPNVGENCVDCDVKKLCCYGGYNGRK